MKIIWAIMISMKIEALQFKECGCEPTKREHIFSFMLEQVKLVFNQIYSSSRDN